MLVGSLLLLLDPRLLGRLLPLPLLQIQPLALLELLLSLRHLVHGATRVAVAVAARGHVGAARTGGVTHVSRLIPNVSGLIAHLFGLVGWPL